MSWLGRVYRKDNFVRGVDWFDGGGGARMIDDVLSRQLVKVYCAFPSLGALD